jgi:hypothetical protein
LSVEIEPVDNDLPPVCIERLTWSELSQGGARWSDVFMRYEIVATFLSSSILRMSSEDGLELNALLRKRDLYVIDSLPDRMIDFAFVALDLVQSLLKCLWRHLSLPPSDSPGFRIEFPTQRDEFLTFSGRRVEN